MIIIASSAILYHFWTDPDAKPKRRRFNVGVTIVFIITRFLTYRRYQKSFVDKVMYDTTTKLVTLTKRSLFTLPYEQTMNPGMLLFTNDKALNKRNINYINMQTLDTFQIGYDYAWKNKALFAHVLE